MEIPLFIRRQISTLKASTRLYSLLFSAFKKNDFRQVNGYSNEYWGWGGEDDDLWQRTSASTISISRPDEEIYRYKMIKHETEKSNAINPLRNTLLKNWKYRWEIDGLSVSVLYRLLILQRF